MRPSALIAGFVGVAVGLGGGMLLPSQAAERGAPSEAVPASGAPSRWNECLARLDAIDARLASLVAPASAPVRAPDETPAARRLDERLAAIEAALANLATTEVAKAKSREESPRRAKDVAAVARLFEMELGKERKRTDDHQGYTADRLYDRYGAPDLIERGGDDAAIQRWVYFESREERAVYFELRNGVVVRTWAYSR